jgi:hypothetical protein
MSLDRQLYIDDWKGKEGGMKRHVLWKKWEMSGVHTLFAAGVCVHADLMK